MNNYSNLFFWIAAASMSIFYGLKAADIFEVSFKEKSKSYKFHQFWLNFIGSLTGWFFTWTLTIMVINSGINNVGLTINLNVVLIFFLAFIGVTGYLPVTIIGIVTSFKEIASKLLGFLK